ncbi:phosphodiester glycosidase family protein [Echinicola sp. 20G]|uniref:phosphodiester glycosidase family protein n=1 Tax=Echinicola sp. 20G TaxID=2781961 RepID=UPI00190FD261|nr:phosphodiester glycosidase family protein [Echinicola sp. 20G]
MNDFNKWTSAFLMLMSVSGSIWAQEVSLPNTESADAEIIRKAHWKVTKVSDGMHVKTTSINLFDSPQEIFMLDIDTAVADVKYFVGMADFMEKTSVQAKKLNAVAAINGSFFRNHAEPLGASRHMVLIDGVVVAKTDSLEFETRGTGVVTVKGNKVDIADWSRQQEVNIVGKADHALTSGPLLMDDGQMIDLEGTSFVLKRHPRSVIAFDQGHLLLIVIGGRSEKAAGMTLDEVQFFCKTLGCSDILNLDGGGSSTLYVKGYDEDDIVNVPTDGTERDVKGIFYITSPR